MTPTYASAGDGARVVPALPVRLDTLTPKDAADHMGELTAWVRRLTDRYQLDQRTIPTCWAQHGEHVEELSALYTAWLSAYALTAPGGAPLAWHESFTNCRTRLATACSRNGCTPSHHREPSTRSRTPTDAATCSSQVFTEPWSCDR